MEEVPPSPSPKKSSADLKKTQGCLLQRRYLQYERNYKPIIPALQLEQHSLHGLYIGPKGCHSKDHQQ